MLLPLTDTVISDCRNYIAEHPDIDLAIVSYLTRHTNGLMCAEIERVISRLVKERVEIGCSDDAARSFLGSMKRNAIRNASIDEIGDKIKLLGDSYHKEFNSLLTEAIGEAGRGKLGIAVKKRDEDAHDIPPNITFNELREAYGIAVQVVDIVQQVLAK